MGSSNIGALANEIAMLARLGAVLMTLSAVCEPALAESAKPPDLDLRGGSSTVTITGDRDVITIEMSPDGAILWNGTPVTCKQMNARFRSMWAKDKRSAFEAMPCRRLRALGKELDQDVRRAN